MPGDRKSIPDRDFDVFVPRVVASDEADTAC